MAIFWISMLKFTPGGGPCKRPINRNDRSFYRGKPRHVPSAWHEKSAPKSLLQKADHEDPWCLAGWCVSPVVSLRWVAFFFEKCVEGEMVASDEVKDIWNVCGCSLKRFNLITSTNDGKVNVSNKNKSSNPKTKENGTWQRWWNRNTSIRKLKSYDHWQSDHRKLWISRMCISFLGKLQVLSTPICFYLQDG